MNNEAQDDLIADVIKRSMGVNPQDLPKDFYQVAWELPRWHLLMLQDKRRLDYYSDIIKSKVKDKIVLDVGTGSGVLSYLALKWGAKKVYSVEQNPALQSVYRHLMRDHIKSGKAELICDDALFLRVDQFMDGTPDLLVHELFGSFGMGENLIPIFRSLAKEGILTAKTQLVPDALEVWIKPVWSDVVSKEGHVEAFEGYPLDELNIFGNQIFWDQDYLASLGSKWQTVGESQLLFRCDLRELSLPDTVTMSFKGTKCSHLKLVMKIEDTKSGLVHINDHEQFESHWANAYLTVPHWLRGQDFKIEFKIHPDKIEVLNCYKA